jgi:hypothetical protein
MATPSTISCDFLIFLLFFRGTVYLPAMGKDCVDRPFSLKAFQAIGIVDNFSAPYSDHATLSNNIVL